MSIGECKMSKTKKDRIKTRIPVSHKASRPIGTQKGDKGYKRKREKAVEWFSTPAEK